jgi:hypothetical protein
VGLNIDENPGVSIALTYFERARGHRFSEKARVRGPKAHAVYTHVCTLFHKALAGAYSSNPRALRHPSPLAAPVVAIAAITRTNMANFDAPSSLSLFRQNERISLASAQ